MTTPDNRQQLARVYSPETWDVYELLDRSLEPRGPDSLYEVAGGRCQSPLRGSQLHDEP